MCTNTNGSYVCSCDDGYTLNDDGLTCDGIIMHISSFLDRSFLDIDECSMNNGGCDQMCTNTNGSYVCSCDDGYTLNDDGLTCDGIIMHISSFLRSFLSRHRRMLNE